MNKIEQLVEELMTYNEAYRSGTPLVSDEFYDLKIDELAALDPNHPYLHRVEPESEQSLTKRAQVRHPSPMLSMEKAYTVAELQAFITRCREATTNADSVMFLVSPKLDGLAGRDDGMVLSTRGNGDTGYDITDAFQKGVMPIGGRGLGVGEIVLQKEYFEANMADQFEHPRNVVVGVVMSDNLSPEVMPAIEDKAIHFVPYATLDQTLYSGDYLGESINVVFDSVTTDCPYPTDGIVISAFSMEDQATAAMHAVLGSTSHHHRWQLAFKRKGELVETTVEEITWQVGRTGKITPVLEVTPVKVSGATIRRVTAHNAAYVVQSKLGVGSRIVIVRSGEVIPKVEQVLTQATVSIPRNCPACGGGTVYDSITATFLLCDNPACPAKKHGQVSHWFKTIGNVNLFGPKAIEKLLAGGYTSIPSIIDAMSTEDFTVCGFSVKQAENLLAEINKCSLLPIDDWRVLASLGIQYLGRGDSKNLCKHYTLQEILEGITIANVKAIDGFAEKTAVSIVYGLVENKELLSYLVNFFKNIRQTKVSANSLQENTLLTGKKLVFTGSMSKSREEMSALAESAGAVVQSSVSKATDYLVIGEKVGAAKTGKAEKLGVAVISEDEFMEMLND